MITAPFLDGSDERGGVRMKIKRGVFLGILMCCMVTGFYFIIGQVAASIGVGLVENVTPMRPEELLIKEEEAIKGEVEAEKVPDEAVDTLPEDMPKPEDDGAQKPEEGAPLMASAHFEMEEYRCDSDIEIIKYQTR